MLRPDFVVAGAMKSGTTWIDEMLRQAAPAVLPATTKELFFFDEYWDRGADWYRKQFPKELPPDHLVGEVASTYYADPEALRRLADFAPDATVLIVLRAPWDRSWSHFQHLIRKGELRPDIALADAIVARPDIVQWSCYHSLLTTWRDTLGENLRLLRYEALLDDPAGFATSIGIELGLTVDPSAVPTTSVNEARRPRSYLAARIAGTASRRLHGAGLHVLVDTARRVGLGRVLERPAADARVDDSATDATDRADERAAGVAMLRERLTGEAEAFVADVGWPQDSWS